MCIKYSATKQVVNSKVYHRLGQEKISQEKFCLIWDMRISRNQTRVIDDYLWKKVQKCKDLHTRQKACHVWDTLEQVYGRTGEFILNVCVCGACGNT